MNDKTTQNKQSTNNSSRAQGGPARRGKDPQPRTKAADPAATAGGPKPAASTSVGQPSGATHPGAKTSHARGAGPRGVNERTERSSPPASSPGPSAQAESKSPGVTAGPQAPAQNRVLTIPSKIMVRDLAELLKLSPINIIRELMKNGVMANINQEIDFDTAAIIAADLGVEVQEDKPVEPVEEESAVPSRKRREYSADELTNLRVRAPVVTIMGHVDHGKTSLLDVIRESNVVASEVGGITQHIGAYQVKKGDKKITFLDTPGHEAFTSMRARGAMATDIAVLVVAADDGVQPQTLEAIAHARAAQVPIIVALNKIDKANANPDGVKRQLADAGLLVEDYGGDVICVPVSAKQKTGLASLLEMILLVAEMADLRANPEAAAEGVVIEGRLDRTRGPLATLLVQDGTLRVGESVVIGELAGKVRAMFDDRGLRIEEAGPSAPVMILGLSDVAGAGETFRVAESDQEAKSLAASEVERRRVSSDAQSSRAVTLDDFFSQAQAGESKELNIILKADVQGSIEPIVNSIEKLGDETLHVRILHAGTGNIGESDVMLAVASHAIVIGFSVQVDAAASRMADSEHVDIRVYDIIYNLIDDIDKALKGMLEPSYKDVVVGHAEVKATFRLERRRVIAGCQVKDGVAARNATARVIRGTQTLFEGSVSSLKRFKDDVREVSTGMECGIGLEGFDDFQMGDKIEFFKKELA